MGRVAVSAPNTLIRPSIGLSRVTSIRMVVVLPAPFGPSRPKVSPGWMARSTWSTATWSPNR